MLGRQREKSVKIYLTLPGFCYVTAYINENVNKKTSCEDLNCIHLIENWVECHTLWSWQRIFQSCKCMSCSTE